MENAPWFVANKPFVLREWNFDIPIPRLNFDFMPLWVRIIDLPPSFLSMENVQVVATMFEQLLEIDEEVLVSRFRHGFVRFKVLFDLHKAIVLRFMLPTHSKEEWIPLMYEKIGDFCYRCGRLTHTNRNYQEA